MPRPTLEVADIVRRHGSAYREAQTLPLQQLRVLRAIEVCRTAALGGHLEECDHCSHTHHAYNSCRNRHCPKCQTPSGPNGWKPERPTCCRWNTSTSFLRCLHRLPPSPSTTRRWFTTSCSEIGR